MCFKVLSGLPGTPTDLKNLIDRSTICGPYGPSGPSGGESNHMVSLVGKARHDGIKKKNERTEFVTNLITHSFIYIITNIFEFTIWTLYIAHMVLVLKKGYSGQVDKSRLASYTVVILKLFQNFLRLMMLLFLKILRRSLKIYQLLYFLAENL